MLEVLPVHPFTGLAAIGVLPSGRPVWPVLGGAPDDDDSGDGGQDGDGQDDGGGSGSGDDGDGLAEAGRKALAEERKARREADKARRAAEKELADLKAAQQGKKDADDAQSAADQARRDAEQAALAKANERILAAEVRAAAAGKLADPSDAARYLDLSEFEVATDGAVDSGAISEAISDLIRNKPYLAAKAQGFQGSGDGGPRGSSGPRQLGAADLKNMSAEAIDKARTEGRLERYLSGS